jgi:hypothetical protein
MDGCDAELVLLIVRVVSIHGGSLRFSGSLIRTMVSVFFSRREIIGSSKALKGSLNGPLATVVKPHGGADDLRIRVIISVKLVGSSVFIVSL